MTQILVVEDEYILATNLQENLESLGYIVAGIAGSAVEAFEQAVTLQPDLVLMDIQLDGETDGIKAAEQIWNRLQIPVIYLTGHSDRSTIERAKISFPFGYLLKPVRDRALYVAIETALSRYEREQLLSTVLRSIGDGMIVVNTLGQIMFLNRSAELLTGWSQAEGRGRDLAEVFNVVFESTRLPLGNPALTAIQDDVTIFLTERVLLTTKDGTTLPVTDSLAPIKNHKGLITGAVLVFRDDTQRQLQEERNQAVQQAQMLQQQAEELHRLNQLKDDFLSTVSHELRTPLTNIKMAIQMLEITLNERDTIMGDPTTDRTTRYLKILRNQCNQELSLVNDLLELQQLEAGARPIEWITIHLQEWLVARLEDFQERAQNREQQLQAFIPTDVPVVVSDPSILQRIVAELLTNACKYTPPGGQITVTVRHEADDRVQLTICNTGVEIAANELSRVFDRFYRVPMGDRWQQGGTGLGLALVKKLVTHLGGSIWAESEAGQTRFIVELFLTPPNSATVDRTNPTTNE
ncbi:MAG: ATP-binding protein [Leptolyngbya sp. BL-A-14]